MRSPRDFRRISSTGRRVRRDGLTVVVAPSPEAGLPARLGLAVRARTAVRRNRIKRRLRGAWAVGGIAPGVDVVVRADEAALEVDCQELVDHLCEAVAEART